MRGQRSTIIIIEIFIGCLEEKIGPDILATAILIDVGDKYETVRYFHRHESSVNRVFIDNPMFLQKVWGMADSKIYDSVASTDNHDTQLCFSLLCLVRNFVLFLLLLIVDLLPSMDLIRMAATRMSTSGPSSARQLPLWRRQPLRHESYGGNYKLQHWKGLFCLSFG